MPAPGVIGAERVLEKEVKPEAHLMSDEWKAFIAVGQGSAAHDTARREYVRGRVHANSAEGFNSRVRRTIAGVFHHISSEHADLYFQLPMVPAHCHGTGHPAHSTWPGNY
jgi:ISXO2-like transposase domain